MEWDLTCLPFRCWKTNSWTRTIRLPPEPHGQWNSQYLGSSLDNQSSKTSICPWCSECCFLLFKAGWKDFTVSSDMHRIYLSPERNLLKFSKIRYFWHGVQWLNGYLKLQTTSLFLKLEVGLVFNTQISIHFLLNNLELGSYGGHVSFL